MKDKLKLSKVDANTLNNLKGLGYDWETNEQIFIVKWFREIHNICIFIEPFYDRYRFIVYSRDYNKRQHHYAKILEDNSGQQCQRWKTYEKAEEQAIQWCMDYLEENQKRAK